MEASRIISGSTDRTPLQKEIIAEIIRLRSDLLETKVPVKFLKEFSVFMFADIKIHLEPDFDKIL